MKDADIDVIFDKVYSIHTDKKMLALEKGKPMSYDKLLIATGGQVRKSKLPGADAHHVYYLRTAADMKKIQERAAQVKEGIAIIGAGFISTEAASALALKYQGQFEIHIVSSQEHPLENKFGKEIGEMLTHKHTTHGITMHMKNGVSEIVKN